MTYSEVESWIEQHDVNKITAWLEAGGDPNIGLKGDKIPLIIDTIDELYEHPEDSVCFEMLRLFVAHGAQLNFEKGAFFYPLIEAIHTQSYEAVKLLLNHGADVNFITEHYPSYTPLLLAIELNHLAMVELILAKTSTDLLHFVGGNQTASALGYAFKYAYIDIIKLLLNAGADPDFIEWDHAYLPSKSLIPIDLSQEQEELIKKILDEHQTRTTRN